MAVPQWWEVPTLGLGHFLLRGPDVSLKGHCKLNLRFRTYEWEGIPEVFGLSSRGQKECRKTSEMGGEGLNHTSWWGSGDENTGLLIVVPTLWDHGVPLKEQWGTFSSNWGWGVRGGSEPGTGCVNEGLIVPSPS